MEAGAFLAPLPGGGALLVGLLTVGALVFVGPYAGPSILPVRLYAPLPFLLWAAVRFGPGGTSASILIITALTIWGARQQHGPFVTDLPAADPLASQLFLLFIALPSVFLAAVMEERQRAFAALSESDITQRKQIEEVRSELAHASRLAVVGELTASVAHEINQPLGAIVSNAQAAQRFLNGPSPDLDELREILGDIVEDGTRAGEVIRHVRTLVKKEAPTFSRSMSTRSSETWSVY